MFELEFGGKRLGFKNAVAMKFEYLFQLTILAQESVEVPFEGLKGQVFRLDGVLEGCGVG